jgi:DNA-directed RNA polymerase subunit RPC12/RpoP
MNGGLCFPANELWGNSEPVCPYCGSTNETSEDMSNDGDVKEWDCDKCGKKFLVQTVVSVQYSTMGDCSINHELPHILKKSWTDVGPLECKKCKANIYEWSLEGGKYQALTKDQYQEEDKLNEKRNSPL